MSETNRRFDVLLGANNQLRRSLRRWQLAGFGAATCLVLLLIGGAVGRPPQAVEAGEFVLRSKDGARRASLTIRPDGTPGLGLFDREGRVRLSLDLGKDDAPGVNLYERDGTLRAAMTIRPDGTPGLGLFDPRGQPSLSLDFRGEASPGVNLYQNGTPRISLTIRPDGTPALGLFDEHGEAVRSFEVPAGEADRPAPGDIPGAMTGAGPVVRAPQIEAASSTVEVSGGG